MVAFLEGVEITLDCEGGEGGRNQIEGQEAKMSESLRHISPREKQGIWIRRRAPF